MPLFEFIAVDEGGQEVTGSTEAGDERGAVELLRARSLLVVDMEEVARAPAAAGDHGALRPARRRRGRLRERERVLFFREMALMLRSGLTLLQSLEVCARQSPRARLTDSLERMALAIQSGTSLSGAMAEEPRLFSRLQVKLVESAEATGELDPTFEQMAEEIERRAVVRRRVLTGLMYPSVVMLVSLGVAVFLILKVVPRFATFFARRGVPLPPVTKALVGVSGWIQANGPLILVLVALLALTAAVTRRSAPGRHLMDRGGLRLPVIGRLLTVSSMWRLARTLSALLRSGRTILESLRITSGVLGNRAVAASVAQASDRILEGRDLASSLAGGPIPPQVPQIIGVGERSGELTSVLDDLARFYEQELEISLQRLSSLVEPAMILFVGGMVGFVYVAFFQAVFQLVNR